MQVIISVFSVSVCPFFTTMLVTTVNSCFPDTLEDKLALSKCDLPSHNRIILFKLFNNFILLIRRELSQLLKDFALILLLEGKLVLSTALSSALRGLLARCAKVAVVL